MKNTVLIILLCLLHNTAKGSCAPSYMSFYPQQKEISTNSTFMIEGYGLSQKTIESFKDRTIYLESENGEHVTLILKKTLKGQKELTLSIFRPTSKLKPNTTYFLKYDNPTTREMRELSRYNEKNVYWKTTDKTDRSSTPSNPNIAFSKTNVQYFGCGPSTHAVFKIENNTKSEIWYKTEVIELSTKKKTTYYLTQREGKLLVGHGMCSGAFKYKSKGKYKVRFTPTNTEGKTAKPTKWFTFNSPYENSKRF